MLTPEDKKVLELGRDDWTIQTGWYFGRGALPKQTVLHVAPQHNLTILGSIRAGKTRGVGMSALTKAQSIPYFRFLNTSITAYQSRLMFDFLTQMIEASPKFQPFVEDIHKKPYPMIRLVNRSVLEFMTAGKEAEHLRGGEWDWINYDEGGFDDSPNTVRVLRGRLIGNRENGKTRLGRLSVTTSPTDVPWLRAMWDRGVEEDDEGYAPDRFLSLRMTIYENIFLEPWQVQEAEEGYPDEWRDVELLAQFPQLAGNEFAPRLVDACTDRTLNEVLEEMVSGNKPGAHLVELPRIGCVHYEMPYRSDRVYIMAGDPGSANPPLRNSGVVMVFDVTTSPYTMVYAKWVKGNSSMLPFLSAYKYAMAKYMPLYRGMDTTGAQKGMQELAFEEEGLITDKMNFQHLKMQMLNAAKLFIQKQKLKFPFIRGLRRQLSAYKLPDDKIAQDLVCTIMMISDLARKLPQEGKASGGRPSGMAAARRKVRSRVDRRRRTGRSAKRR